MSDAAHTDTAGPAADTAHRPLGLDARTPVAGVASIRIGATILRADPRGARAPHHAA
jgi:hypothetical protein